MKITLFQDHIISETIALCHIITEAITLLIYIYVLYICTHIYMYYFFFSFAVNVYNFPKKTKSIRHSFGILYKQQV